MPKQIFIVTRPPEQEPVKPESIRWYLWHEYDKAEWIVSDVTDLEKKTNDAIIKKHDELKQRVERAEAILRRCKDVLDANNMRSDEGVYGQICKYFENQQND